MRRILTTASILALAGIGWTTLIGTLGQSPAFNATLREENVFGVAQLRFSSPMYETPAYLFQLGTSYLRADLVTSAAETGSASDYASTDVALARAETAAAYFERSLERAPANAHVWASLAWARTLTSDIEGAREALARSWSLAPNNRQLANRRLLTADVLFSPDIPELSIEPTEAEKEALARDREVLDRYGATIL